jgi:hypothetical protein
VIERFSISILLKSKNAKQMHGIKVIWLSCENRRAKSLGLIQFALLMQLGCTLERSRKVHLRFPYW